MNPVTLKEASEALNDIIGFGAENGSALVVTKSERKGAYIDLTFAHENARLDRGGHRNFVIQIQPDNEADTSKELKEVGQDMSEILETVELLLIASAMYSHEDKRTLIDILNMLRGDKEKANGWKLVRKGKRLENRNPDKSSQHNPNTGA